jgi:hypothetical protein
MLVLGYPLYEYLNKNQHFKEIMGS